MQRKEKSKRDATEQELHRRFQFAVKSLTELGEIFQIDQLADIYIRIRHDLNLGPALVDIVRRAEKEAPAFVTANGLCHFFLFITNLLSWHIYGVCRWNSV
jgi:hypothetical protein